MVKRNPKQKANDGGEAAYKRITGVIAQEWDGLEIEDRLDLALNLVSELLTQVVRITMSIAIQDGPKALARVMNEMGQSIGAAVRDGYLQGSDGVCPCGNCGPVDVTVEIHPILDGEAGGGKLDSSPAKPGSMVN